MRWSWPSRRTMRGLEYFYQVDPPLLSEALALLNEEVCPAILHQYGAILDRMEVEEYCTALIPRITSRTFCDTIARGTRD